EKQILEDDVEKLVEGEEESDGTEFADTVLFSNEDSGDRIEPESHKENPKKNDVDKKKDDKKDDNDDDDNDDLALIRTRVTGSSEIRREKMRTPIPSPPRSPRTDLSSDKANDQELTVFDIKEKVDDALKDIVPKLATTVTNVLINDNLLRIVANAIKKERESSQAADVLKAKFEKSSASVGSYRNDVFRKCDHDEHQGDDAPLEGEKSAKRQKMSKGSKYARDEVIPEDETSELIDEFQNVNKRVPTIFDREGMKATIKDMLSNPFRYSEEYVYHLEQAHNYMENQIRNLNEPPRYLYNKDLFFWKNGNTQEKWYVLSLHKNHAISIPKEDLEKKMIRWVKSVFKTFNEEARLSIQHWKDTWHKRMYKINHRKVRYDPKEFFSDYRIVEVVRVTTEQQYGLDFM
ncbi:hypothetical protein Tco_1426796, partial [Tanacetum coccineum]